MASVSEDRCGPTKRRLGRSEKRRAIAAYGADKDWAVIHTEGRGSVICKGGGYFQPDTKSVDKEANRLFRLKWRGALEICVPLG